MVMNTIMITTQTTVMNMIADFDSGHYLNHKNQLLNILNL